jgi:glycosyltransferase involved in cell wall biosynthesis
MRVLALTRYGRLGASSRLRFLQFGPALQQHGVELVTLELIADDLLRQKYLNGRFPLAELCTAYARRVAALLEARHFDLAWVEKEALPWWPASLERHLLRHVPCAIDLDDAIFHRYDRHPNPVLRRLMGRRIDRLMAGAALVTAGNNYLARRAEEAGARRVELVPTVVEHGRYRCAPLIAPEAGVTRLVWIGSPSTADYLQLIARPLERLSRRHRLQLWVIGARSKLPGVEVVHHDWAEATECGLLASADIGLMPLRSSEWELGKCGYKLIQYMAAGLPVVASSVGANIDIVRNGQDGYLAQTPAEWEGMMERLLEQPTLRSSMGEAGRARVEARYSVAAMETRLAGMLRSLGSG